MNLSVLKNAANFFDGQFSCLCYSRRILIQGNDRLGSPSAPQPQQRSPGIHYMGPVTKSRLKSVEALLGIKFRSIAQHPATIPTELALLFLLKSCVFVRTLNCRRRGEFLRTCLTLWPWKWTFK